MEENDSYENRLQQRILILKEQLENGKIKIFEGLGVIESLKKVRYRDDGTVDLSTVDGLVRSLALAAERIHNREEIKKYISLAEIQFTYFKIIDLNFGGFFKLMKEKGLTPHQVASRLSESQKTVDELTKGLNGFVQMIKEFWGNTAEAAQIHMEDSIGKINGIFGGDLFPSHNENIASKCGIYTDTIILPCPFLRTTEVFSLANPKQQAYYLMKHGLNLLQYKELACADVSPPIVAIIPGQADLDEDEKRFYGQLGVKDAVTHAEKIFGRTFSSFKELMDFASKLDTMEKVYSAVKDRKRVLINIEWEGSLEEKISRAIEEHSDFIRTNNPGIVVATTALGRMGISNELLIKAQRLNGLPLIDAPTSWQYIVWKLEYDANKSEKEANLNDLHIVRGMQSLAENEMEWLGKIPPKALIEVRKEGAIDEIRKILGDGISELVNSDKANFHRTSDKVFDNIHAAFKKHKENIDELSSKKWKFAGSEIGSWLVVGSLAVTAAATGEPIWALSALAADQVIDAPKLKDIPKSIKDLANKSKEIKRSPAGLLFKYSQKK